MCVQHGGACRSGSEQDKEERESIARLPPTARRAWCMTADCTYCITAAAVESLTLPRRGVVSVLTVLTGALVYVVVYDEVCMVARAPGRCAGQASRKDRRRSEPERSSVA